MNGIRPELQHALFMTLVCMSFTVPGRSQPTYYCSNGNEISIENEVSGTVITRLAGESHYSDNLQCTWVINAGSTKRIKLTITSLDLQWSASYALCSGYDFLSVTDGPTESSPLLLDICHSVNPYELVSSGQYLRLIFTSNDKNFYDRSGITIHFETYDNTSCPPGWRDLSTPHMCYTIMTSPTTGTSYALAQQYCGYSYSNLVTIDTTAKFDAVQAYGEDLGGFSKMWIGLNDLAVEGMYKWLDGSPLTLSQKLDQFSGSSEKDCIAHDFTTKKWEVEKCDSESLYYMCAKARVGLTTVHAVPEPTDDDTIGGDVTIVWAIVLGIVGGACCVVLVVVFYCCWRRKNTSEDGTRGTASRARNYSQQSAANISLNQGSPDPTVRTINIEGSTSLVWGNEYETAPPTYDEALQDKVVKV